MHGQPDFSSPLAPAEYAKLAMEDQFMKMRRDRVPLAGMAPLEQQRLERYCGGLLPQLTGTRHAWDLV